jgi:hypothetical protein
MEMPFRVLLPAQKLHQTPMTCAHLIRDINVNTATRLYVMIPNTCSIMKSSALATTAHSTVFPTLALYLVPKLDQPKVMTVHFIFVEFSCSYDEFCCLTGGGGCVTDGTCYCDGSDPESGVLQ